jgi:Skp family chaperone for outer membrane proteins
MWKLAQFAVLLLTIWVGYNYFFGNEQERKAAEGVTSKVGSGIVALKDFAVANKDQLQLNNLKESAGKVGDVLKELGAKAKAMDEKYTAQYEDMKAKKQQLDDLLVKIDDRSRDAKAKKQQISDEMNKLIGDMERLNTEMENR